MKCPNCSGENHRVLRTDEYPDFISRTRLCGDCGKRWITREVLQDVLERATRIVEGFEALRAVMPPGEA